MEMAELQGFQKEKQIQTCEHLANSFLESIEKKYQLYHEVHLVFDRYDVPMSLKLLLETFELQSRIITSCLQN